MAVLPIVTVGSRGDELLRRPGQRVRDFGPELHALLDDMLETLREAPGVGLAAPQVGVAQRVAVIEYPADDEDPESPLLLFEIINPEIIKAKGSEEGQEGCLSMPGLAADVSRATQVVVRAQNRHGEEVRIKAYDWLARIFQHEIDHLLGVLMTDRADQVYRMQQTESGEWEAVPIENTLRAPTPSSST